MLHAAEQYVPRPRKPTRKKPKGSRRSPEERRTRRLFIFDAWTEWDCQCSTCFDIPRAIQPQAPRSLAGDKPGA